MAPSQACSASQCVDCISDCAHSARQSASAIGRAVHSTIITDVTITVTTILIIIAIIITTGTAFTIIITTSLFFFGDGFFS